MDTLNEIRDAVVKTVNTVGKTVNNLEISTNNSQYFEFNTKLEDIKKMLDGDSDKDKMDSMKRLIAMISKGRDVSAIFPAVVKNVISKNIELKKLVYMYLTHYAEMEPDSSLLAINSFQKDLANSNQYIRASALRVMSSIRVKIISQIIVMSIQKAVKDPSPYVRKTSAHAISKVFGLDIEHKDELIECIRILLQDRLVMVLGSAVAAWNEVCPERYDLIHPHYRKLCHLLADTDEWGQIMTLNMLTKYARIHFEDPNKERQQKEKKPKKEKKIFDNDDDEDEESDESDTTDDDDEDVYQTLVDPDLKLLLTNALPLLKNRNTGVVLSVATLYFYCAPLEDVQKVIKAVVRCAKGKREVEYIVLANIATMAQTRPALFEPYLTEFFVKPSDAAFVRNLKLEIVTLLVNSENINKILKEFKSYVTREEKDFVVATIQAIGRCASSVPEVTDRCLFGLMSLLSNPSDVVVAESVVVIKKLLQMLTDTAEHETTMKDVITQLVRILDTITSPSARASILWVIGEYCHKVPLLAPDVLRKLAKTFTNEDAAVKLQTLNLGAKLYLTNPDQTTQIFEYVINLARYDMNYDIRDKCRILRALLFAENPQLKDQAKKLLLTKKPIPTQVAPSEGRKRFMLGTLSHVLSHTAYGYAPLSDFPEKAPDKKVRDEVILEAPKADTSIFWSDSEEESFSGTETGSEEEGSQSESEEEEEESGSEEEEEESEEEESEEESSEEEVVPPPRKAPAKKVSTPPSKQPVKSASQPTKPQKDSLDDLFNFGTPAPAPQSTPPSQAKKGQKPASQPQQNLLDDIFSSNNNSAKSNQTQTSNQPKYTLLKPHLGGGLGIEFSYVRAPSMLGNTIKTLVFYIKNQSTKTIQNIRIGKMALSEGSELIPFPEISSLGAGEAVETNLSVRFHSVTQPLKFAIASDQGEYNVSITPLIGELVRAAPISVDEFKQQQKKLKGLSEASDTVSLNDADEVRNLPQKIQEAAYLAMVDSDFDEGRFWFGGKTMIEDAVLLVAAEMVKDSTKVKLSVTSESTVLNSVLLQHLKKALLTQS